MRDSSNLLAHYDGENKKEQLLINQLEIGRASCRERV